MFFKDRNTMTHDEIYTHIQDNPPLCHVTADWEAWPSEEVGEQDVSTLCDLSQMGFQRWV